jgi:molybdopterin synthase sulfur carrier subunit
MAVTVRIPTTMRPISGGASTVEVPAGTLGEVLKSLDAAHNGFGERLFDGSGDLHKFVNISCRMTTCVTSRALKPL